MTDVLEHRKADYAIEPLLLRRRSPRAMNGEPLTDEEMLRLFEAARWAPSTMNEQEWRFLYARRNTSQWPIFFALLADLNRVWCQRAAMLVVIVAHRVFERNGQLNPVHLFDCGSAYENLALQGTAMGLVVHAMQGFDFNNTRLALGVPEDYAVAAMFAVGRPGDAGQLPDQLREREKIPSGRKPVKDLICEGSFGFAGNLHPAS